MILFNFCSCITVWNRTTSTDHRLKKSSKNLLRLQINPFLFTSVFIDLLLWFVIWLYFVMCVFHCVVWFIVAFCTVTMPWNVYSFAVAVNKIHIALLLAAQTHVWVKGKGKMLLHSNTFFFSTVRVTINTCYLTNTTTGNKYVNKNSKLFIFSVAEQVQFSRALTHQIHWMYFKNTLQKELRESSENVKMAGRTRCLPQFRAGTIIYFHCYLSDLVAGRPLTGARDDAWHVSPLRAVQYEHMRRLFPLHRTQRHWRTRQCFRRKSKRRIKRFSERSADSVEVNQWVGGDWIEGQNAGWTVHIHCHSGQNGAGLR